MIKMSDQKTDTITLAMETIGALVFRFVQNIWKSVKECFYGYMNGVMPFQNLTIISVVASLFWAFKCDVILLKMIHTSLPGFDMSPSVGIFRLILWGISISIPFIFWGWRRKNVVEAILMHLQDAFESAGLKCNDKYPKLIREYVTDNGSRVLQLLSDGVVLSHYFEKKEILENKLGVEIEDIRQHKQYSKIIEIEFASGPLEEFFALSEVTGFDNYTFPIGKTRTELIIGDLKKIPHYLFAGMTGKGKSSFIKTLITVLLANNKKMEIYFIDLKGSEIALFHGHPKVQTAITEEDSLKLITAVDKEMTKRKELFRLSGVADIDSYSEKVPLENHLSRIVLVVDEIAQLTPTLAVHHHKVIKEASLLLNKLARMGRSHGIHLLIGVQKPDSRNLDTTIKSCIEGILCFQVANRVQSQVVLDNSKAADLGGLPGRAVWQTAGEEKILQTPFLSKEKIAEFLGKEKNGTGPIEQGLVSEDAGRPGDTKAAEENHEENSVLDDFSQEP